MRTLLADVAVSLQLLVVLVLESRYKGIDIPFLRTQLVDEKRMR